MPRRQAAVLDPPPHVPSNDGEELSELEVQNLLEQRDKERAEEPKPIPVAEYLEAAMEPVAAAVPASLPETHPDVLCSHCKGSGRVPVAEAVALAPVLPRHALDDAAVNSKIVVVLLDGKSHAVLGTPDGAKELPVGDPAHRLPEGARIRKLGHDAYLAEQMSPVEDHEPKEFKTAAEAIDGFIAHFHATGLA